MNETRSKWAVFWTVRVEPPTGPTECARWFVGHGDVDERGPFTNAEATLDQLGRLIRQDIKALKLS